MSIQYNGFVTLPRSIKDWRWYHNANTFRVFLHLVLSANFTDHDFEGITVHRGQVVTSRKSLAEELNLSEREIRTALTHLKSTNDIAIKSTTKFSIITVISFDDYQGVTNTSTNERPSSDQRATTLKEKKEGNKGYSREIVEIIGYLNQKAGTNYRDSTANTVKHLSARLKEGYTVEQIKVVIDSKVKEWQGTDMSKYLRPDTLFGSKFESYHNAVASSQVADGTASMYAHYAPAYRGEEVTYDDE